MLSKVRLHLWASKLGVRRGFGHPMTLEGRARGLCTVSGRGPFTKGRCWGGRFPVWRCPMNNGGGHMGCLSCRQIN